MTTFVPPFSRRLVPCVLALALCAGPAVAQPRQKNPPPSKNATPGAPKKENEASEKLREALGKLKMDELDERRQIDKLRAYQLALIRLGEPAEADRAKIVAELDPRFPAVGQAGGSSSANADAINKELVNLLVYLKSPTVVAKTLVELQKPARHEAPEMAKLLERNRGYGGAIASMIANHPDLMQIHYAFALRNVKEGWTAAQPEYPSSPWSPKNSNQKQVASAQAAATNESLAWSDVTANSWYNPIKSTLAVIGLVAVVLQLVKIVR